MKNIIKLSIAVAFICALSGASMCYVYNKTKAPIAKAEAASQTAKMKLVLPAAAVKTEKAEFPCEDKDVTIFQATDDNGQIVGYAAVASSTKGFGGEVRIIIGLDANATITGIVVDKHSETPGVGSNMLERKRIVSIWDLIFPNKSKDKNVDSVAGATNTHHSDDNEFPPNRFLDGFNGKIAPQNGFQAGTDIECIAGATFTCNAVLDAVNKTVPFCEIIRMRQ